MVTIDKKSLAVFTFSHFWVDFCCFYLIFLFYTTNNPSLENATLAVLTYNVIAFGLQPLLGYFCDKHKTFPMDILSFVLLIIGLLLHKSAYLAILIMALGNACFHIAGGIASLQIAKGKMGIPGLFVATGAIGVAFGTLAGRNTHFPFYLAVFFLLVCLAWVVINRLLSSKTQIDTTVSFSITNTNVKVEIVILFAFLSITIRSFAGSILPLAWRTTTLFFLFPAIGSFTGKAIGGFIADKVGARKTAFFSLLSSAFILLFGYNDPWLFIIGITLFNMTMSVTLCAITEKMPDNSGLAFGITTLDLLCGNFPIFFIKVPYPAIIFALLVVVSTALLYYILDKGVKYHEST